MPPRRSSFDPKQVSRVQAIQGGPPPPKSRARQAIFRLEQSLRQRARAAAALRAQADKLAQAANGPLIELLARDKRARAASEASARLVRRRKTGASSLSSPLKGLKAGVSSGSIVTVVTPPYDYEWTWNWEEPGSHGDPSADRSKGVWGGHTDNVASCAAGVGIYFRPVSERAWVRFIPNVNFGYYYVANSHYHTAYTSGFLGVFISSVDSAFRDPRTEIDARVTIWDVNQFGNGPLITDRNDRVEWAGSNVNFFAVRDRQYFVWTWGGVSSWGHDDYRGTTTWSQAYSNLWASTSVCLFEQ